ncbi:MAG: C_GCAxxG_C_C family protein [Chloroflexi bacterium]|nr:C_GCAxxG_C_C family protein [Chloroflexota bacterium]
MLLAVGQGAGLDLGAVPRIATGFGGGISRQGSVCGALVGAVMALGLKYGRQAGSESPDPVYSRVQQLYSRFEQEMGGTICRQLTGMDLTTPEGYQKFRASDVRQRVCARAIALGTRLAQEACGE